MKKYQTLKKKFIKKLSQSIDEKENLKHFDEKGIPAEWFIKDIINKRIPEELIKIPEKDIEKLIVIWQKRFPKENKIDGRALAIFMAHRIQDKSHYLKKYERTNPAFER